MKRHKFDGHTRNDFRNLVRPEVEALQARVRELEGALESLEIAPDRYPALILKSLIKQHDASGLWAADCGCTWHSVSRAYLARVLGGHEARATLEGKD